MPNYTTVTQKYAQPDVVNFWKALSRTGLQQCEREMVARYFPRQGRLLDIGCGTGRAMLALNQVGYEVTGIDISQAMLAGGRSLSHEAQLAGANLLNLPFVDASFDGVFMFFGALQHIPGRDHRRRALAEMARVTRPHGRLILGLDNVAPGLACYRYWLAQKLRPPAAKPTSTHHHTAPLTTDADSTLWDRQTRRMHPLVWHARGLARTLRWRTWPGLRDDLRRLNPLNASAEPGDVWVAQFAIPTTPGRIYYHLYQVDELIADAAAGWRLLGHHSGSELNEQQRYPAAIRGQDKQLFFAFERE